jgi:hypothetical protein
MGGGLITKEGSAVRIALGQLESSTDIDANLAAIDRFADAAALDGASLVAFPEYATYEKKKVDETFPDVAETLDGPVCRRLANTARRHRIALVAGVVETSDEPGKAYNTLVASGATAPGSPSSGRSTSSTPRVSGNRHSSSRVRLLIRWCLNAGECGSGSRPATSCGSRKWPAHWPTPAPRCCWSARPGCRARIRRSSGWR